MRFTVFTICSIIGVLAVLSNTLANPIEVIYTGDTCECQKNLNYFVQKPPPPAPCTQQKTTEYGYKMDVPVQGKAKVTYSFDFTVLEPKRPPPSEQPNLNLYAKMDRVMMPKKDCHATASETVPSKCSCSYCAARRYVTPEDETKRFTRSSRHPNSIADSTEPATSSIMAIFVQPLAQTEASGIKSRHKRDITRIFMRPRKNEKRSERIVKQYNKPLTAQVDNKPVFEEISKPISSRSVNLPPQQGIRPLHQLKNFLNQPRRLRNKRDIKGEYDLIEEERQQMDLTLPEIIQYMPETLDPNFKRGPCQLGQPCIKSKIQNNANVMFPIVNMSENNESTYAALNTSSDSLNVEEKESNNAIKNVLSKRNAVVYGSAGGCPLVFPSDNPTPSPSYTYEPLNEPFGTYGLDPVPQQYVSAPRKHYAVPYVNKLPLERSVYGYPNSQSLNNAQMDQIIAEIINKHADFIEASSYHGGPLLDPLNEQEHQTKSLLKNLVGGFIHNRIGDRQPPRPLGNMPYYQGVNALPPLVAY